MANKPLPTPDVMRQLLRYESDTGKLFWREIPERNGYDKRRNTIYAGKPAFESIDKGGYLFGQICRRCVFAHRAAWVVHVGAWPTDQMDHINGNKTDNRISNLRVVTASENARNRKTPSVNTSGVCGVTWHRKAGKWQANIGVGGVLRHLGLFESLSDAKAARISAEQDYGFHRNHGRVV